MYTIKNGDFRVEIIDSRSCFDSKKTEKVKTECKVKFENNEEDQTGFRLK